MDSYEEYLQRQQLVYPAGKRELLFGLLILACSLAMANFTVFGGLNLGFAVMQCLCIVLPAAYLRASGRKLGGYKSALLILSLVIALGFARSADGFVKFVMACFLFVAVNLGLCLHSEQNLRSPAGVMSLLDAPRAFFSFGFGKLPESFRGLREAMRNGGTASKKTAAVLSGLVVAVPLLVIVVLLLVSADAAFAGLVDRMPKFDLSELMPTVILGGGSACVLYAQAVGLHYAPRREAAVKTRKGIEALTVNTVLVAVCLVYLVYLFSQLAYVTGGLSGILPAGFTMAEYARRGFFEMGWLCAINLGTIALAVGLVKKTGKAPLSTRLLCLFMGIVTLFFVVTASAKMAMYIGAYGLTRLRVLTEIIMDFLGIATSLVCAWLFIPKLPYMKAVLIIALVIGAVVLWADVDTVVAGYNVSAYRSGKLDRVDVGYLTTLSAGAVPYIAQLAEDGNTQAQRYMERYVRTQAAWTPQHDDLRSWNLADWLAGKQWEK